MDDSILALIRIQTLSDFIVILLQIFGLAALAVYCVDTFFMYRDWQSSKFHSGSSAGGTTGTTSTTTTTHTTYETRTQY
jgi:hypothetical protein